jgi:hypothetical protein
MSAPVGKTGRHVVWHCSHDVHSHFCVSVRRLSVLHRVTVCSVPVHMWRVSSSIVKRIDLNGRSPLFQTKTACYLQDVSNLAFRHPDRFLLFLQKKDKVKVKSSLCLTNKALGHEGVWGSCYTYPHFLDFGSSRRCRPLPLGKFLVLIYIRGSLDPRAIAVLQKMNKQRINYKGI